MELKNYSDGSEDMELREQVAGLSPLVLNQEVWLQFRGIAELVAGILFILGIFLPLGAVFITLIMLGAIVKVHGAKGFSNTAGGFEYNLVLIVVSIGLALIGPGVYSL